MPINFDNAKKTFTATRCEYSNVNTTYLGLTFVSFLNLFYMNEFGVSKHW